MSTARELTNHLAALLRNEQSAMAVFLLALADFDRKKLWRELGHTSLFYYLHRELRLSKGAAQNRKSAAELIEAFPEVEAALRAGELCLSTVNEVAKVLTPENRAEVLPRFFGLSRREAEAVAMSLRPAEVVPARDVITAIRPAAPALRAATTQAALPAASPEPPTLRVHPDEPQPVAVHVNIRRGLVEKPRKARRASRRDTIPAEVKQKVWRRAGGQCEWRFESGERCGCRRRLEYDHIEPVALGGASTIDNVRLACRPHNLLSARQVFGDAVMDRYTRRPSTPEGNLPLRATGPATSAGGFPAQLPAAPPASSA